MPYLVGMLGEDRKYGFVLGDFYVDGYINFCACWSCRNWRRVSSLALVTRIKAPLVWGAWKQGIIPTLQSFPTFGRVYAAYGGVFVVLAVLWGWLVDKKTPDIYDWLGAAICIVGVSVMLWAPRS